MGQSLTELICHLIFSTKDRQGTIAPDWRQRLYDYIGGILRDRHAVLLAAGGTRDHVHLLVSLHPTGALADVVRDVKAGSSKWIHETFADTGGFAWQAGYAAFSVSHSNVPAVRTYLANQDEHHATRGFQEELLAFVARHEVPYDERYIWK